MDWFIWLSGFVLVGFHIRYLWRRSEYSHPQMELRRDRLLYLCEFFPLLGLTGTMLGLMGTFGAMDTVKPDIAVVIQKFSPALSTTISGLGFLMVNLLFNFWLSWRLSD